jgi:hypothetical protein
MAVLNDPSRSEILRPLYEANKTDTVKAMGTSATSLYLTAPPS